MRLVITLLLLLTFSSVPAQVSDFQIDKSEVFKDKKKHTFLAFSESDGQGGLITVRIYYGGIMRTPKGYYIEHFSSDLKLLNQTEIEIDKNEIEGVFVKDGKINLVEKRVDDDRMVINILTSGLDKLNFSSKELFSFDEDDMKKYFGVGIAFFFIGNGFNQMDDDAAGQVSFSSNKEFMAFNFDIKDKDREVHRVFVYNSGLEKVYEREFKRNIEDKYFDYEDLSIDDNDGSVYFLGKVYEGKSLRSKKKGKANYHYEIFKLDKDGQKRLNFDTKDHFVGSLTSLKGDDYLSCVGFYSDKNDSRYKGVVRYDIDPVNLTMKKSSFQPFTEEFIIDKYGKQKDKELRSIRFRDIFMLEESGDIIMNAEEYYSKVHQSMNNGSSYVTYHYNDIISARISAGGKLLWARNINKRQVTSDPGFNTESFTSSVVGDKTYVFINGSEKVKKIRNNRIEFKGTKDKKYNLYAIEIDENGDFEYKIIQTRKELEVPLFVSNGIVLNNGLEVIFLGRRKQEKQLVKVSIP